MSGRDRALLVVGSPRGERSTSASLGRYLLRGLEARGFEPRVATLVRLQATPEGREAFVRQTRACSLAILSFPLYWDSLPAGAVRGLETWHEACAGKTGAARTRFVALCNSGFPEARQSETALGICRRFARETGLEWAGGLALGGGAALDGCPLERAGGRARHARVALDLAAAALAAGEAVPPEAVARMARPFVPAWAYTLVGSWGWRRRARAHGAHRELHRRPYEA